MTGVLMIPAVAVTLCFVVVWFGVADDPARGDGRWTGAASGWSPLAIALVMGGLILVRLQGPGQSAAVAAGRCSGLLAFVPFARLELRIDEPLIDVRLLATPAQWPVQLTAFLFGMSVLGAQIPLSTFARTDPDVAGYGLGASAGFVSTLIGVYVVALVAGALLMPVVARAARHARGDGRRVPARRRSATRCSCRSTARRSTRW